MHAGRKSLGICIGASSIKAVELIDAGEGLQVGRTEVARHDCNTRGALLAMLPLVAAPFRPCPRNTTRDLCGRMSDRNRRARLHAAECRDPQWRR